jgi:hypothetical protein
MADTITIPGVGPTKKVYVVAGVAVIGGVLAYAYWKRSQADAAAAAVPAVVDSSGASGYTEDSTAAGYNTISSPTSYSPYGYDLYGNPLPPPTGAGSNGVYTTNADWATAAESALESETLTLATIQSALGRVLGGLSVTSAQRDIFMQAVGILGQPPQGYPTPIKLTDDGSGSTPTGPLKAPTGLKVTSTTKTTVGLQWTAVTGAAHYRIYDNVSSYNVGDSADTQVRIGGLRSNTTYHFHVRALDAHNTLGASSASVSARTKK